MFNSVQYVRDICKERKISVRQLEQDCGFGNGYLSPKKINKIPYERAIVIAEYLGISVENILNGPESKKTPILTKKDRRDIARDLELMMAQLDAGDDLMFDGDPISDEAKASIRNALQMGLEIAKVKNKERFTPKKYRKD